MYNTGISTQYSVMTSMGKESKKVDICICITDSFCCTVETNLTLQINCTPIKINSKKINKEGQIGSMSHLQSIPVRWLLAPPQSLVQFPAAFPPAFHQCRNRRQGTSTTGVVKYVDNLSDTLKQKCFQVSCFFFFLRYS